MATLAARRGRGLRIAVTGPTWVAVDTVARRLPALFAAGVPGGAVHRLVGRAQDLEAVPAELRRHVVRLDDGAAKDRLQRRLSTENAVTVVASTVHQIAKLTAPKARSGAVSGAGLFDFMLIDEASQLSVAQAVVGFAALADGASVAIVGDDLQMPPISPVDPPAGSGHLVGSIYDFYRCYRSGEPDARPVIPTMLDRSFRSNAAIVEFVKEAGYNADLVSARPDHRIALRTAVPTSRPADWPASLPWSATWSHILDPARPLVCVIHDDGFSGQRNDAEARAVAALAWCLRGRLLTPTGTAYAGAALFERGVGVVTPHRAQRAAVIAALSAPADVGAETAAIAGCVDTVERFQGQERATMIVSYGVGDPDQIASEERFLYDLRRFNVAASRAEAKLVVFASRNLVEYLPRDPQTLRASRLLKTFATTHLPHAVRLEVGDLGLCEVRS